MKKYQDHFHRESGYREDAPLVANAATQKWFALRQDVPIGFEMLIIKNNMVEAQYSPGMKWTSRIPLFHKGGIQAILVDVRERYEEFDFESELYTSDQFLINLTFAVYYKVSDIEKVALRVKDPLSQMITKTRAKVLDITLQTSMNDFIINGSSIYINGLSSLSNDLNQLGLEFRRVDLINFKLPDSAREKFAEVMGENREMLMEINRLKMMKDQGVIDDYLKLELIKSLSKSNFPPMQLFAMQMMDASSGRGRGMMPDNILKPSGSEIPPGQVHSIQSGPVPGGTGHPTLNFLNGELAGTSLPLKPEESIIIGRDPGKANIVISHPKISRMHLMVKFDSQSGRFDMQDLNSTHGVVVNGRPLKRGEKITLYEDNIEVDLGDKAMSIVLKK